MLGWDVPGAELVEELVQVDRGGDCEDPGDGVVVGGADDGASALAQDAQDGLIGGWVHVYFLSMTEG